MFSWVDRVVLLPCVALATLEGLAVEWLAIGAGWVSPGTP